MRFEPDQNLPLSWRGTDQSPQPSPIVAQAFAAAPVAFGLRDMRDPSAVGLVEEDGWIVRTSDNVAQFCSNRLGEILQRAAPMNGSARVLETVLEFRVVEGTFSGKVGIRGRAPARPMRGRRSTRARASGGASPTTPTTTTKR
jgi:hypothetical protein